MDVRGAVKAVAIAVAVSNLPIQTTDPPDANADFDTCRLVPALSMCSSDSYIHCPRQHTQMQSFQHPEDRIFLSPALVANLLFGPGHFAEGREIER